MPTVGSQLDQPNCFSSRLLCHCLGCASPPKATDDDNIILKCSARLAVKSKFRSTKSDAQVRKVLMKKLRLEIQTVKA